MNIVDEIKGRIEELEKQLLVIQEQCTHPKASLSAIAKGSTGNYDSFSDSYWIDFHCKLCDKKWNEPQ